jgi:hypothetical protein
MTDRALANAEKRRDIIAANINKCNQELEALRKDLAAVETFISDWHRFAGNALDSAGGEVPDLQKDTRYPQADSQTGPALSAGLLRQHFNPAHRKNPDRATVGKNARDIISAARRPVLRTELFQELAQRGLVLHGKDPEMVLSTMMWRMQDQFVRLAGHGYWLRELPWPLAGYEPSAPVIGPGIDEEEFELLRKDILDPASMADVEPPSDVAEATMYRGFQLRPHKQPEGWIVFIEPSADRSSQPTRTTMNFASLEAAIEDAKKVADIAAGFRRRI